MRSYVRKSVQALSPYVPGEQPRGTSLIKLNTNENPYPPSAAVQDLLRGWSAETLRRYPDPVSVELRQKIASLHGCDTSEVFIGNGSDEVLALCIRAFVEPDGSVGFFDPSYSLYTVLAAIADVEQRAVSLSEDFTWRMPEGFTSSLFFLTNPNAPTSMQFPKSTVRSFCEGFDGVVVVDEAYVDFAPEDCMELALSMPNVLVARTLSKSYSLAGIRLGYAVGPANLIEPLYKIKDSYNVDTLSQAIALAAVDDQKTMQDHCHRIKKTRDRVRRELSERKCEVADSATNFLWVKPAGISAQQLFGALKERNILVRHFPSEKTADYLRITVGTDEDMDALVAAWDDLT